MNRATADAVVVGGGIIGSAIALRLAQRNLRVVVLDQQAPGSEASPAAAGVLSPQVEAAEKTPFFQLCAASRDGYPSFAAELRESTGLDVELRLDGVLYVAGTEAEKAELDSRFGWQFQEGLPVERLSPEQVKSLEPSLRPELAGGFFFPKDGQVESSRVSRAVTLAAAQAGVRFEAGNPARRILHAHGRVEGVQSASGAVWSPAVVNAAGAWANFDPGLPFPLPVSPARGELVAVKPAIAPQHVLYSHSLYAVPRRDGRLILGATMEFAGFDKTVKAEAVRKLLATAMELIPSLEQARFDSAWAGLRPCAPDHLPLIGPTPIEGLFLATGHCRNGILLAPVTAKLITELVTTAKTDRDLSPFSLARFREI